MARILVIASYTPSLVHFRGDMLREIRLRGHEVFCCSPDPDPETLAQLDQMGVGHLEFRLQRAGITPLSDLGTMRDLRRIIREVRPDHVLSYTIKPVIFGSLAAWKEKVPFIHAMITGLGIAFQNDGIRSRALNAVASLLYRAALRHCATVFFQNPDDRRLFVNRSLVDVRQVVMINGSGINLERFPESSAAGPKARFLLIARLIEEKGVAVFARAARLVRQEYPEAKFTVVGPFDKHPSAISRTQMESWVSEGLIDYAGPTSDVRPFLKDCNVYCLPSYYREGVPRSILEALATGRAVITTDAPGCRETVDEGQNGILVPPQNPRALATAMKVFCADPGLFPAMGVESRRLAETKFDVVKVNAAIMSGMGLDGPRPADRTPGQKEA